MSLHHDSNDSRTGLRGQTHELGGCTSGLARAAAGAAQRYNLRPDPGQARRTATRQRQSAVRVTLPTAQPVIVPGSGWLRRTACGDRRGSVRTMLAKASRTSTVSTIHGATARQARSKVNRPGATAVATPHDRL